MPDDVSVVGYDDIFFSEILEVPLTSVRQPLEELGSAAASLLMEIANGETENKVIQFVPQLIVRKSTANPKEYKRGPYGPLFFKILLTNQVYPDKFFVEGLSR